MGFKFATRSVKIGDIAPDFEAESTKGLISFHKWSEGFWVLLFSHPADFTPICSTEIAAVGYDHNSAKFRQRGVLPIALSTDSVDMHHKWLADIRDIFNVKIDFPVIDDSSHRVAALYGMIHPRASRQVTIRKAIMIDPAHRVRAILEYPLEVGRNTDELLRIFDALRIADAQRVATPADWQPGNPTLVPADMSDDEADRLFPGRVKRVRDYLRVIRCAEKSDRQG